MPIGLGEPAPLHASRQRPQRSMHAAKSRPRLGNPHISTLSSRWYLLRDGIRAFVATPKLTRRRTDTVLDRRKRGSAVSPR